MEDVACVSEGRRVGSSASAGVAPGADGRKFLDNTEDEDDDDADDGDGDKVIIEQLMWTVRSLCTMSSTISGG